MATANAKINLPIVSGVASKLPANFDGTDCTQSLLRVFGWITIDANPATYATGGLPIVNVKNTALSGWAQEPIKASQATTGATAPTPLIVYIESVGGSGYVYQWNASTNKLQIFTSNGAAPAALAEFTNNAAIPAAVSGDTILFEAVFSRI